MPSVTLKKLGSAPAPGVAADALVRRCEQRSASMGRFFLHQPPPGVPAQWLKCRLFPILAPFSPFPHVRNIFPPPVSSEGSVLGRRPRCSPSNFSQFYHLTTLHPMRKYPSSSVPPVRALVAYAIGRPVRQSSFGGGGFFDIVRPPGGRLKFLQTIRVARPAPKTRSPTPSGQIRVNPTSGTLRNGWISGFDRQLQDPAPRASHLKPPHSR